MNDQSFLNEQITHHIIRERVARASEPHLETGSRRHRFAARLHRVAERIDG